MPALDPLSYAPGVVPVQTGMTGGEAEMTRCGWRLHFSLFLCERGEFRGR